MVLKHDEVAKNDQAILKYAQGVRLTPDQYILGKVNNLLQRCSSAKVILWAWMTSNGPYAMDAVTSEREMCC